MNLPSIFSTVRIFSFLVSVFTGAFFILTQPAASMGLLTAVNLPYAARWDNAEQRTKQIKSPTQDMTKGYWHSRETRDKYCIRFGENENEHNWGITECFDKNAFEKKQTDVFQLTRQTGTLTLTGKLDQAEGDGNYEFVANEGFKKYLTEQQITSRDENFMFHLYLADMQKGYIEFLKSHYTQIEGNRVMELAIHEISQKKYQEYIGLFEKYSGKKPSMQEVIEAKIHGIDQAYVEEIQANGFTGLDMKKMMEAKIHGVNAAFINSLKQEGFANLSMQEVLSAKIHGIDPSYIGQMRKLGFTNLNLEKLSEAKIHGVNASYIRDLETAGFSNLPINKLIEAKIHGVTADFISEAKNKGYKLASISDYISLKIHGMTRNTDRE